MHAVRCLRAETEPDNFCCSHRCTSTVRLGQGRVRVSSTGASRSLTSFSARSWRCFFSCLDSSSASSCTRGLCSSPLQSKILGRTLPRLLLSEPEHMPSESIYTVSFAERSAHAQLRRWRRRSFLEVHTYVPFVKDKKIEPQETKEPPERMKSIPDRVRAESLVLNCGAKPSFDPRS